MAQLHTTSAGIRHGALSNECALDGSVFAEWGRKETGSLFVLLHMSKNLMQNEMGKSHAALQPRIKCFADVPVISNKFSKQINSVGLA